MKQRGGCNRSVDHVLEFLDIVVVEDYVNTEDVLYNVHGFSVDGGHAAVVDDKDGDGLLAVDLVGELSLGEVVIESAERWVIGEDSAYIKRCGGGKEKENEEKENGK